MNNFAKAQIVCKFLPPIISQYVRNKILTFKEGEVLSINFRKKAITGSQFIGNTNDFHALKFGVHGYFDWRNVILVNEILKSNKGTIVEVGANIGTETICFADIAKKQQVDVIAFEPVPANYDAVCAIKKENNLNELTIINKLVSHEIGYSFFKMPDGNESGSGFIANPISKEGFREFEVTTLNFELLDKKKSAVFAIDVEGFEFNVLLGGIDIIKKDRPFLILEVNENYLVKRGNTTIKELDTFLGDLEYKPFYIDKLGLKEVDISNFKVKSNKNWICIPKEKMTIKDKLSSSIFYNALNPFINYRIL